MTWTPWIRTESDDTSNEETMKLFKKTRNPLTGDLSDLVRITSLTPEFAGFLNELGSAAYRNADGLTAREKEVLALVTSSFIGCVH